jgi:hypothetical protein
VKIADSAHRHGVAEEDIWHAIRNALTYVDQEGRIPERTLVIGPARSGRPLEVVILRPETDPLVIHAMDLRTKFYHYLPNASPGDDHEQDGRAGPRRRGRGGRGAR